MHENFFKCKIYKSSLTLISIYRELAQEEKKDEAEEKAEEGKSEPPKKVWSQANFAAEYRKFNIDMTPKVGTSFSLLTYLYCSFFFIFLWR